MKIGFIFLTVNDIKNADVWQHWFANATCEYQIFIHSKNKYNDYPEHSIFKNKLILKHAATSWGILAQAQIYLWEEALSSGCDYTVLLSDKCVPLNHFEFLHFDFMYNNGLSYMYYQDPWWPSSSYRKGKPPHEMKGSPQWIIIHSSHLKILATSHIILRHIKRYCMHPDDECYPATTLNEFKLLNSDNIVKKTTTFTDWKRRTADVKHPYTFNKITEFDYNLLKAHADKHFFARKFEEMSVIDKNKILHILDERLFNTNYSRTHHSLVKLAATK